MKRILSVLPGPIGEHYAAEIAKLKSLGHRFQEISSPSEAIAVADVNGLRLVIVGLSMAEMEGLEFVAHLQQRHEGLWVPVVVLPDPDDDLEPLVCSHDSQTGHYAVDHYPKDQIWAVIRKLVAQASPAEGASRAAPPPPETAAPAAPTTPAGDASSLPAPGNAPQPSAPPAPALPVTPRPPTAAVPPAPPAPAVPEMPHLPKAAVPPAAVPPAPPAPAVPEMPHLPKAAVPPAAVPPAPPAPAVPEMPHLMSAPLPSPDVAVPPLSSAPPVMVGHAAPGVKPARRGARLFAVIIAGLGLLVALFLLLVVRRPSSPEGTAPAPPDAAPAARGAAPTPIVAASRPGESYLPRARPETAPPGVATTAPRAMREDAAPRRGAPHDAATPRPSAIAGAPLTSGTHPLALQFAKNSSRPAVTETTAVERLARAIAATRGCRLTLMGHASAEGSARLNYQLGRARARAARRLLQRHGVSAGRLATASRGASVPVHDHGVVDPQRSRRVELEVRCRKGR